MKKFIKSAVSIALSVIMCFFTLFVSADFDDVNLNPADWESVCTKGTLSMEYRDDIGSIRIVDCITGKVQWNTTVTEDIFDVSSSTATWQKTLNSVLSITYAPSSDTRGNSSVAYSADVLTKRKVRKISNGIKLELDFCVASISLEMKICLDDGNVTVSIPYKSIKEYGDNILLYADVFPYFGAAAKDSDGYIFYPDGSGALSYFSKTEEKPLYTESIVLDIYGSMNQETLLDSKKPLVMLPVYGIKNGNKAFIAAATKGDTQAKICVNTAVNTSPVPINCANFRFVYRNEYRIYLSNISSGVTTDKEKYGIKREKNLIKYDADVRFFLLDGESADYSGMAKVYREYLLDNGMLKKSKMNNNGTLSLSLFMGARKNGFIKSFVKTCDYDSAYEIINGYLDSSVKSLFVKLKGWSSDGYGSFPQSPNPANVLGGKKGLKNLNSLASENKNLNLSLEINLTDAKSGEGSFSKKKDVLIKGNSIPVSNLLQSDYILSPTKSKELYAAFSKKLSYADCMNFSVEGIGNEIYYNSYKKDKISRQKTADIFRKIAEGNSVEGGNLYILSKAQMLYDIPFESKLHVNTDESVPFYQMVIHGSIPYCSAAGNLYYDMEQIKLKWVEYGFVPSFELTDGSTSALKKTNYNELFSADNSKWQKKILSIYDEFSKRLSKIGDRYMISHKKLTDDIVRVDYSGGYTVFVNYSEKDFDFEGKTIPAHDYILVKVGSV